MVRYSAPFVDPVDDAGYVFSQPGRVFGDFERDRGGPLVLFACFGQRRSKQKRQRSIRRLLPSLQTLSTSFLQIIHLNMLAEKYSFRVFHVDFMNTCSTKNYIHTLPNLASNRGVTFSHVLSSVSNCPVLFGFTFCK